MKITNKSNLPTSYYNFAKSNVQKPVDGQIRVTESIEGLCESILKRRHWDDIEVDCIDLFASIEGTSMHTRLESYGGHGEDTIEDSLILDIGNYKLKGTPDIYNKRSRIITDHKRTTTWKIIYKDYSDWLAQGLRYALLIRENHNIVMSKFEVIATLKDWSMVKAKRDRTYPQKPIVKISFDITDNMINETFLAVKDFMLSFDKEKNLPDCQLSQCSAKQRWAEPDKYAVMKEGRKRAIRVFDNKDDALNKLLELDKKHYIEFRKGKSKKCKDYCLVSKWCPHHKED